MGIEFIPPGLEGVINGPYAERRLRDRDGFAYTRTDQGDTVVLAEGAILDVHAAAVVHDAENPHVTVQVVEFSCSAIVAPVSAQEFLAGQNYSR